jgi:3-hydroxyacyl-CoA dehydrogenase/enoyl-CoA hydratase/3-hydroxybutyryl-CoA epimerase
MSSGSSEASWRWERGLGAVWTLWFDQPGRSHNLLDPSTLDELEARLVDVEGDSSVKGLMIKSAKPGGFCAGADLKTILACTTAAEVEAFVVRGLAVLDRLSRLAVPTVAVVHGVCLGGGLELALACRRRVALASSAPVQVGNPEVQHGLIPGWGAITKLPRLIGPENALDLLISGRSIGYLQARSLGIVDRLAAEGDSREALELMEPSPRSERTWPKEVWEAAWNHARERIDEQPTDYPEAQLQILAIVAIDVAYGPEAARTATTQALAQRAVMEDVKASLASFFQRGRVDSHG